MTDQVRVLHLLTDAEIGGGPRHVLDLIGGRGHGITPIVAAPPGPMGHALRQAAITYALPLNRLTPSGLRGVLRVARHERAQVIHSHGKGAGLYGRLAGHWLGIPTVHTFHGLHLRRPAWAYLALERSLLRWTSRAIHVSPSQLDYARSLGLGGASAAVIPNGVRCHRLRDRRASPAAVLSVARFERVKALGDLVSAFAMAGRGIQAALWLVGDGPQARQVKTRCAALGIGRRTCLPGLVVDPARWYEDATLYASTSLAEGCPYGVLDAMAWGLPVVATATRGHDMVEDGKTGRRVRRGLEYVDALRALILRPDLAHEFGANGRAAVEAHYRVESMVMRTEQIYEEVI